MGGFVRVSGKAERGTRVSLLRRIAAFVRRPRAEPLLCPACDAEPLPRGATRCQQCMENIHW